MSYVYLLGTGIYALIWISFFLGRRDLRRKILYSSLFCAPLGLSETLFIPDYWLPQFDAIYLYRNIYLESLLFCFFLGGVVSAFYQVVSGARLFKTNKTSPYLTLIGPLIFTTYFLSLFQLQLMFYAVYSMFISSIVVLIFLKSESIKIIYSALINVLLYTILFIPFWYLFPQLSSSYQFDNLCGILVGGIPIEEFLWIFTFSLYWTPVYEIWSNHFHSKQV